MKAITKVILMITLIVIDGGILQFLLSDISIKVSLPIGLLLSFGIGFGWYAKCAEIEKKGGKK